MKTYTTSIKPSSSVTEKHENKISRHTQLKEKSEIFDAVRITEDPL